MLLKTKGIVLRQVKYSETSLICDVYTAERGRQSYIVSGVRKKNARIGASLFQLMSQLDMVVYQKEQKTLNRIKEVKPSYIYQSLPFDVMKGMIGMFMIELAQKVIKEQEPNESMFRFLTHTFQYLDVTTESVANIHLSFMVQLSKYLGFMPDGYYDTTSSYLDLKEGQFVAEEPIHQSYANPSLSPLISVFMEQDITTCHNIALNREQRRLILDKMIQYYQYHCEGFTTLNSFEVLKSVF